MATGGEGTGSWWVKGLELVKEQPAVRPLAGRVGPVARPLARHKQSTGLFVSGLGLQRLAAGRRAGRRPGLQPQVREDLLDHRLPGHGGPGVRQA